MQGFFVVLLIYYIYFNFKYAVNTKVLLVSFTKIAFTTAKSRHKASVSTEGGIHGDVETLL